MVLLDLSTKCKRSVAIPTLQVSLRLREAKELPASMCQNQGSNSCVCWAPDSVFPTPGGGPFPALQARAMASLRDILSFQDRQVTGQRASLVTSFSGRGQGRCLQGQSSSGQRGRAREEESE